MGLFDWLRGADSNITIADDYIWLTNAAKLNGLWSDVLDENGNAQVGIATLLVAHFPSVLSELQTRLERVNFGANRITLALASHLGSTTLPMALTDQPQGLRIIVAERHPLPPHDEQIVQFARKCPCLCTIVHHLALDEPLMRLFAGEWVTPMLERMGMTEDQPLQSKMITRRMRQTQKQIEQQAVGDVTTDSAEQWFQQNCPKT
jgi:hypothetical protein